MGGGWGGDGGQLYERPGGGVGVKFMTMRDLAGWFSQQASSCTSLAWRLVVGGYQPDERWGRNHMRACVLTWHGMAARHGGWHMVEAGGGC